MSCVIPGNTGMLCAVFDVETHSKPLAKITSAGAL
jgi:hypothetical protein